MKVIFVTRGWPTADNPMMGIYEAVQARALAKRGIDVTVVSLKTKSLVHAFEDRKIQQSEEDGIMLLSTMVVQTEIPGVKRTQHNPMDLWLRQKAFCRVYEHYRKIKGDADVIHAHFVIHAHICRLVLERYNIPFVITEHWSKMNYPTLEKNIIRQCEAYQWADKVICVSKALSESLKKKLGVDSMVVNNMVSDHFFDGEYLHRVPSKDCIRFIGVGSLVERKGYDLTIKALAKAKNLDRCLLNIVGAGPEEANLRQLIESNNLQDKVFLLGQKLPQEVSELIASSDCFILTSRVETFGIVYIEAMAKGKPVIATICGGPEFFVDKDNGILIPAEDMDAAAAAIDNMVENISSYNGAAIRKFCHENFSEESISQRILGVYKEIVKNKNNTK